MKNIVTRLLLIFPLGFFAAITVSCDDNEPEIMGIEPYFKVKFINQDSLTSLKAELSIINEDIKTIDELIKEASDINTKDSLNAVKKGLNKRKTVINDTIKVINSGKMRISKLWAEHSAAELLYEDSAKLYKFPLNTKADYSRFFVVIKDVTDTIDVEYKRETVMEENVVRIKASDFKITYNSFEDINELKLSQSDSTNLSSNGATATIYF